MTDVDAITIDFDAGAQTTLRIVIGLILLGVALDTRPGDFARVIRRPGTIAIAIAAQVLLLPALTFLLTLALDLRASVALGLILVACCPAGSVSNILTARAGGDVALSVSMTAVGSLLAIVAMPMVFAFWGGLHPTGSDILRAIELDPLQMVVEVGLVIGLPFSVGLAITRWRPREAAAVARVVGPAGIIGITGVILVGVANNWAVLVDFLGVVLLAVFLHDALALALGYGIGRAVRLPEASTRALTFEVGVRNAGLGLLLVLTYFEGLGGMALAAAWWGIWDLIVGLVLASVWARRAPRVARLSPPARWLGRSTQGAGFPPTD